MNPPEAVHGVIEKARVVRNLKEHLDLAHRDFLREITPLEVSASLLEWALTCTEENSTPDEYTVAQWVIGKARGKG